MLVFRALYDTIPILHESKDNLLLQTAQRTRDSFEANDADAVVCTRGTANFAGALTKRNMFLQTNRAGLYTTVIFPELPEQCRLN